MQEEEKRRGMQRILSLLGLAQKAGFVASGELPTEKSVRGKKSHLVVAASDSSDNTKKKLKNMCSYYGVKLYFISTKNELGAALGKEFRASASVNDAGMAGALEKKLMEAGNREEAEGAYDENENS